MPKKAVAFTICFEGLTEEDARAVALALGALAHSLHMARGGHARVEMIGENHAGVVVSGVLLDTLESAPDAHAN